MKKEILNNNAVTVRVADNPVVDAVVGAVDVVESAVETVEGVLHEAADVAGDVVRVTRNNPYILAGVFVAGVAIGAAVAYKVVTKREAAKLDDAIAEKTAEARSYYATLYKDGELSTPEGAAEKLIPAVKAQKTYGVEIQNENGNALPRSEQVIQERRAARKEAKERQELVTKNVFVESPRVASGVWDQEAENAFRETIPEDIPFIISYEEFNAGEMNYNQVTLAYYVKDDTLVDERDTPVEDTDRTVGDDNLVRWGDGSHDANVVYIRNHRLSLDFEVVKTGRSYKEEVLGLTDDSEIRHSSSRREARRRRGFNE